MQQQQQQQQRSLQLHHYHPPINGRSLSVPAVVVAGDNNTNTNNIINNTTNNISNNNNSYINSTYINNHTNGGGNGLVEGLGIGMGNGTGCYAANTVDVVNPTRTTTRYRTMAMAMAAAQELVTFDSFDRHHPRYHSVDQQQLQQQNVANRNSFGCSPMTKSSGSIGGDRGEGVGVECHSNCHNSNNNDSRIIINQNNGNTNNNCQTNATVTCSRSEYQLRNNNYSHNNNNGGTSTATMNAAALMSTASMGDNGAPILTGSYATSNGGGFVPRSNSIKKYGGANCQLSSDFYEIHHKNAMNLRLDSTAVDSPLAGAMDVPERWRNQLNAADTPTKRNSSAGDLDNCENSLTELRLLDLEARTRLIHRQGSIDHHQDHQRRQQHQQQQHQQRPSVSGYMDSPLLNNKSLSNGGEVGFNMMTSSNTGSAVSSLVNMDSPRSPPQATSPTDEMRELLEQIRQLQRHESKLTSPVQEWPPLELDEEEEEEKVVQEEEENSGVNDRMRINKECDGGARNKARPQSVGNAAEPGAADANNLYNNPTKRPLSFQNNNNNNNSNNNSNDNNSSGNFLTSFLNQSHTSCSSHSNTNSQPNSNSSAPNRAPKKPNRSFYIPVTTHSPAFGNAVAPLPASMSPPAAAAAAAITRPAKPFRAKSIIQSPTSRFSVGAGISGTAGVSHLGNNRRFGGRLSRSAPTTPGTALPALRFDDVSPLLDERDEEEPT